MTDSWTYEQREHEAQERVEKREAERQAAIQEEMATLVGRDRTWHWFTEGDLEVARETTRLLNENWVPEDYNLLLAREACDRVISGGGEVYRAGIYDARPEVQLALAAIKAAKEQSK